MTIDFQGLLNVLKASESEPNLYMGLWRGNSDSCETTNCMIGAFCASYPQDELRILDGRVPVLITNEEVPVTRTEAVRRRFNLSLKEARFLFTNDHAKYQKCVDASHLSKKQALNRLRKFIYYKLHKQEMTLEEARRIDGNKAVIRAAQESKQTTLAYR